MPIKSVHDKLEKQGVVVSRFLSRHGKGKGTTYLTSVIPLPSRARKEADGVLIYFEEKPSNVYLTIILRNRAEYRLMSKYGHSALNIRRAYSTYTLRYT